MGNSARLIGIVVIDGFSMLTAAEVVDVFDKANQVLAVRRDAAFYKTVFASADGNCVSSSARIDVVTHPIECLTHARAIFIANGEITTNTSHAEAADKDVSIGNEAASLSAAGIATRLNQDMHSAFQQSLDIIRQDLGVLVFRGVLNLLSDQQLRKFQIADNVIGKSTKDRIRESARWITRNCNKAISITFAAQTAGMSDRSYLRHFRSEMGVNPSEHLRRSRVERAAAMLESSDLPIDKIARRCGLTSGECLARLFRQIWHISPTEYRSRTRINLSKT